MNNEEEVAAWLRETLGVTVLDDNEQDVATYIAGLRAQVAELQAALLSNVTRAIARDPQPRDTSGSTTEQQHGRE
jgi:hypothetical protein